MQVVAVLVFCVAAAAAVPTNPQRIVGGSTTTINQYPSIVVLLYSRDLITYGHSCGGTIISTGCVLTAAHCTVGDLPSQWRVRTGSTSAHSGGTVYNVASYVNHASYNSSSYDNDISIMRVSGTIVYTSLIQPAAIAATNYNLADNQSVWAAGWGTTAAGGSTSETLRHVEIWTVNQATCKERYTTIGATVTDNMLCSGWLDVGGRDQCQGDSGGPLYHNNVIVGICSWGMSCALAYYPGVNARVSRYTTWIQANV